MFVVKYSLVSAVNCSKKESGGYSCRIKDKSSRFMRICGEGRTEEKSAIIAKLVKPASQHLHKEENKPY
jgi:hypothetical protein